MARTTKKATDYAEELRIIDEQIAELQVRKNDVLGKKRAADMAALSAFLEKHCLDAESALQILSSSVAAGAGNRKSLLV